MLPPLKWSFGLLLILVAYSAPACAPNAGQYTDLETRLIEPLEGKSLLLQVDYGHVQLLASEDRQIHVQGQALFVDDLEYAVVSTESQVSVRIYSHHSRSSEAPLLVTILVPPKLKARVETEAASIRAQGIQGDLEITSTSGDITLEQVTGVMTLHSNRGDITVQDSSGVVSVVGNYGILTAQNVTGDVGISTIMGNIAFSGSIGGNDNVRLETDHGSVYVDLAADSDLSLQVRSTSGEIACMRPALVVSTRTCDGEINSGSGSLSVRTVSGAVTLQMTP
jgi:DUF4097 and DUF4098 domain-containing protein YvlB